MHLARALAAPFCLDDAIAEAATEFLGVRAVYAVNLDTLADGDEAEDWVSVDRMAAVSQLKVDTLQMLVDNQHVIALLQEFLGWILEGEVLCTFGWFGDIGRVEVVISFLYIFVDDGVYVEFLFRYILVEIGVLLVSHLLDDACHGALDNLHLAVLESSL